MPVVQVSRADNRELYQAVADRLGLEQDRPDGLLLHAASETADGDVEIVDVWASREQLEAFARERLFPQFEAAGVMGRVMERGEPAAYEPFHYVG